MSPCLPSCPFIDPSLSQPLFLSFFLSLSYLCVCLSLSFRSVCLSLLLSLVFSPSLSLSLSFGVNVPPSEPVTNCEVTVSTLSYYRNALSRVWSRLCIPAENCRRVWRQRQLASASLPRPPPPPSPGISYCRISQKVL